MEKNQSIENDIPLSKKRKHCFAHEHHEFNNVSFPDNEDHYRVTMTSDAEGVVLWLENKKSKQQWQMTITDVAECGPQGIPAEVVISFLKVSRVRFGALLSQSI
jgi:hypothetical protein